jgi:hypothetical protein
MQGRQVDHDAMKMIEDLCENRIPHKLESSNFRKYEVEWVGMAGHRSHSLHFLLEKKLFYSTVL